MNQPVSVIELGMSEFQVYDMHAALVRLTKYEYIPYICVRPETSQLVPRKWQSTL